MKILIVEDEVELLLATGNFLTKVGFVCELTKTFMLADEKIAIYQYDIILLDITLPDGNGLDLLKHIKQQNPQAGIIIISAKNALDDKIKGLDLGADDYLTKPFQLSELHSRIRAVFRRRRFDGNYTIQFSEIILNTESRSVTVNKNPIMLTKKEYDMLLYFIINKNRVLTKEAIAEHLWGDNIDLADNFNFIYTHINNLRNKIKKAGGEEYVKTLYGIGYKFTDE